MCVHRQFSTQAGFPNRFLCVFCTSLRYFRRIPMHMQPKSVSFSSPLACSSCLALKRICCHCHYQYVFLVSPGCVPPSCQIRLLFGCLDSEPNTAVNTVRAKSKHHEVLARSVKKQRCLLCSCERSCSFPTKNGLKQGQLLSDVAEDLVPSW